MVNQHQSMIFKGSGFTSLYLTRSLLIGDLEVRHSLLYYKILILQILIFLYEIPCWINLYLSLNNLESMFLCLGDMSGFTKTDEGILPWLNVYTIGISDQ